MDTKRIILNLLQKTHLKYFLVNFFSVLIGIETSIVASCITTNTYNCKYVICLILLMITLLLLAKMNAYYIKLDKSIEKSDYVLQSFDDFGDRFKESSHSLYEDISKARKTNILSLSNWNKRIEYNFICNSLYDLIIKTADKGNDFSVSIILKLIDPTDNMTKYLMISHRSKIGDIPKVFHTAVDENEAGKYYYGKLFAKNSPAPAYLITKKEVDQNFYFEENTSNLKNYSQYIGIPICCTGNKMNALLQIIGHNDSYISLDKDRLIEFVNKIVYVYANYALYCEKVERGLLIEPND